MYFVQMEVFVSISGCAEWRLSEIMERTYYAINCMIYFRFIYEKKAINIVPG